jgi:D-alanyl-D-alanine dipeptidase
MGKYDFFPMTKKSHALNKESTKGTPTQIAFVDLEKLSPKVELDIKYATDNNFVKQKVYPCAKCYLVEPAALSLTEVAKELKEINLGLKVFDGLRPLSVQKKFWEVCPDERYVANPAKGSRHNRGMAVDLTLIDLDTKQELTMPSGYDDMSQRAHRSYEAMPSQEVKINCKLLELIMEKHNFVGFQTEWWHFDHKGWEQYPVLDLTFDQIAQQAIPVA